MFCQINGIQLYYEVQGDGTPMILVHGNGEDHTIFDQVVPELAKNYTVYTVDSRCHGQSGKTPMLSYGLMAADMIAFIQIMHLQRPIFYGFSDGGIIGLLIALSMPKLLGKLIISGANLNPKGLTLLTRFDIWKDARKGDPLARMMLKEPRIEPDTLRRIKVPTVVLAGQHDCIRRSHTEAIAAAIPHATLEILPGETHESYIVHSPKLLEILKKYL